MGGRTGISFKNMWRVPGIRSLAERKCPLRLSAVLGMTFLLATVLENPLNGPDGDLGVAVDEKRGDLVGNAPPIEQPRRCIRADRATSDIPIIGFTGVSGITAAAGRRDTLNERSAIAASTTSRRGRALCDTSALRDAMDGTERVDSMP